MSNPVSVVYVMGQGSLWNNWELTFSLRSIEKHLKNIKDVWIIGFKPDFVKGVNHVPMEDKSYLTDTNILNKILRACEEPGISDDFLFINDDHYLLADFDAAEFPNYYSVTLEQYLETRTATIETNPELDRYSMANVNTINHLKKGGFDTKNFDIHYPILYNKQKFKEIMSQLPKEELEAPAYGYVLKSIYANSLRIEGVPVQRDCKFSEPPPSKYKCLSTYPRVTGAMYRFLIDQFPKESQWEIKRIPDDKRTVR